jgi:hypothetical protein
MRGNTTAGGGATAKRGRPGKKQGATGDLTTFWHVKNGHERQLRAVLEGLDQASLEDKAHAGMLIGTLHDIDYVLDHQVSAAVLDHAASSE